MQGRQPLGIGRDQRERPDIHEEGQILKSFAALPDIFSEAFLSSSHDFVPVPH